MSRATSFTARERAALLAAWNADAPPPCPACEGSLSLDPVRPGPGIPYVRRRTRVSCSRCRRLTVVDEGELPIE